MDSNIKNIDILGVKIAVVNMQSLLNYVINHLKKLSGKYICVTNVHTLITAYDNDKYREVQNKAVLAIPDGGPLSSYGRKHGYVEMWRTTGPDFMNEIMNISEKNGYRHYFFGSTQETLDKLQIELNKKYPNLLITGMYSPPFRKMTEEEDLKIINDINITNSDFVWVGLGAPKQELWMYEHKDKIKGLMVGVGAAFDYFAGNIKRAPMWMQKCNLEWLYRLMQDPKRLFFRYFYTNIKFIYLTYILRK